MNEWRGKSACPFREYGNLQNLTMVKLLINAYAGDVPVRIQKRFWVIVDEVCVLDDKF